MSEGVGYLSVSAVGKEATPNIAVNATQRLRALEFAPDAEYGQLMDESLSGQIGRVTPEQGMLDIKGAWKCYNTYTLANLLLEHFFGTLASGAYTFDNSLVGKSLTWAIDKIVSIWELSGVKINQLELSWGADGVELSGTCLAQGLAYNALTYTAATISAAAADNSINDSATSFPVFVPGDKITISGFTGGGPNGVATVESRTTAKIVLSGVSVTTDAEGESVTVVGGQNTAAELAALLPNTARRMKLAPDLNVRLGVASAPLTATEEIKVSAGKLTFTRPMAETHYNGTRGILEPSPDNFLEGKVDLTLVRYNTNQYQQWKAANTRLSLRVYFDEENGGGTQEWIVPNFTITTAPNPISGPGFIPQSIQGDLSIGQDKYGPVTTVSASTTDDSFNDTASGFKMMYPGAKIYVSGFVDAADNGEFTVVSRTASKIIVTANLVTEAAPAAVTIVSRNPFCRVVEA